MLKIPTPAELADRAHFAGNMTQQRWIGAMKNIGCIGCHQLGQLSTRTMPASLGTFASGADAWRRRVQSGQAGDMMFGQLNGLGPASFQYLGDWTDRIAKGEIPHSRPPRPHGAERNIVITLRDWMDEKHYLHDLISSDRRYPDRQRKRTALRIAGVQLGHHTDSRSRREQGDHVPPAGARSADAAQPRPGSRCRAQAAGGVAVLGRRGDLGHACEQPQFDVRSRRPPVAGRSGARAGQSGVLS